MLKDPTKISQYRLNSGINVKDSYWSWVLHKKGERQGSNWPRFRALFIWSGESERQSDGEMGVTHKGDEIHARWPRLAVEVDKNRQEQKGNEEHTISVWSKHILFKWDNMKVVLVRKRNPEVPNAPWFG